MFFWNSLAFSMIQWMLAIWSLVPLPFLNPAWIWKFTVHVLLKPSLENFEHYFTSVWDECNCAVVWAFFGTGFLWDWNENWPLPVLWPLLCFPNLLAYWVQQFYSIIFQDLKRVISNNYQCSYTIKLYTFTLENLENIENSTEKVRLPMVLPLNIYGLCSPTCFLLFFYGF